MWRERRKIVEEWRAGRAAAMATLVAVDGSSYRKPGARLLVTTDGSHVGSLSGGCLEAEVARKARWHVRNGACVQRYSTAFDDETNEIPYGLGCGGIVDILLEPAHTPEFESMLQALAESLHGRASDIFTVLPQAGQPLARTIVPLSLTAKQRRDANDSYGSSEVQQHHELLTPPQRLLVFGAGDDAQSLVSIAALLGWRIAVIDGRAQLARAERFPGAEHVLVAQTGEPLPFRLEERDFAVVMTHSYEQDRGWLEQLLPQNLPYLGLLGARHRSARLAGDLAARLQMTLDEVCASLRAPVGLDLGGDGADTIALAIVAEMQAFAAHRPLLPNRITASTVLEQGARKGKAAEVLSQCALVTEAG